MNPTTLPLSLSLWFSFPFFSLASLIKFHRPNESACPGMLWVQVRNSRTITTWLIIQTVTSLVILCKLHSPVWSLDASQGNPYHIVQLFIYDTRYASWSCNLSVSRSVVPPSPLRNAMFNSKINEIIMKTIINKDVYLLWLYKDINRLAQQLCI